VTDPVPSPEPELAEWRRLRQAQSRRRLVFGAGALVLMGLGAWWFVRPPANPPPRTGRAVPVPSHGASPASLQTALVAWSPGYRVSFFGVERFHSFDIGKYDAIARAAVAAGAVGWDDFEIPPPASDEQLAAVHDTHYLASLRDPAVLAAALEVALPTALGGDVLERRVLMPFRRATGGTIAAARHAAGGGLGVNLGGGFHHARPDHGHGFCVYNDVAVAIAVLRDEGFAGPILIVDTDAHQGDGDHAFFAGDPSVYSFSMQQRGIFPFDKVTGDLDVALDAGTDDAAFNATLQGHLDRLIDEVDPALVVHVAGSDVLLDDPLAGLALSPDGLVDRDLRVADAAERAGAGLLHVLAGGYGPSSADAQGASVVALLEGGWRAARDANPR